MAKGNKPVFCGVVIVANDVIVKVIIDENPPRLLYLIMAKAKHLVL